MENRDIEENFASMGGHRDFNGDNERPAKKIYNCKHCGAEIEYDFPACEECSARIATEVFSKFYGPVTTSIIRFNK